MCGYTDLLILDADVEGLLAILLAAAEAEDAENLVDLRGEEGPCPRPMDSLSIEKTHQQMY